MLPILSFRGADCAEYGKSCFFNKTHQCTWLKSFGQVPPVLSFLLLEVSKSGWLRDSSQKSHAGEAVQINGLYADLPVDVCFDLRLAGAFQKLSAYDISKLPHCILSQEAKVFVDQSGDAIEMPLSRVFDGKVLGVGTAHLIEGRHDFDVRNVRMVIIVTTTRRVSVSDKPGKNISNWKSVGIIVTYFVILYG